MGMASLYEDESIAMGRVKRGWALGGWNGVGGTWSYAVGFS